MFSIGFATVGAAFALLLMGVSMLIIDWYIFWLLDIIGLFLVVALVSGAAETLGLWLGVTDLGGAFCFGFGDFILSMLSLVVNELPANWGARFSVNYANP